MKRVSFLTLSLIIVCFALLLPVSLNVQAQRGNSSSDRPSSGTQQPSRPTNNPSSSPSRQSNPAPQQSQNQPRSNPAPSQSDRQSSPQRQQQAPSSSNNRPAPPSDNRQQVPSNRQQAPSNNRQQTPSTNRQQVPSHHRPAPPSNRPNPPSSNRQSHSTYRPSFHGTSYTHRTVVRHHAPRTVYVLPVGYRPYRYMGVSYSFYNGFYYRPYSGAYIMCRPPAGFVITAVALRTVVLSPVIFNPTVVVYRQPQYYYSQGTFYVRKSSTEYRVVGPPIGAMVYEIPYDYEEFILDGQTYYKVDDTYYAPVFVDGDWMYEVVGKEVRR